MENLTNIPGLQHIAEEIFLNLDNESLVNCFKVNRLWKNILNSSFWMKKCKMYKRGEFGPAYYVPFRSFLTWTKVVEVTPKNTILEEELAKKLKFNNDVQPACLPPSADYLDQNSKENQCFVSGWGSLKAGKH